MNLARIGFLVAVAILVAAQASPAYAEGYRQKFVFEDGASGSIDWSEGGLITAQGIGFPAGNEAFPSQRQVTACVAARVVAQRRLLEIIEGVSMYGGATIEGKGLVEDVVRSQVQGVLVGAVVVGGSQEWDSENSVCTLTMAAPLANVRDAIPPLGLTDDGELIFADEDGAAPSPASGEFDSAPGEQPSEADEQPAERSIVANDDAFATPGGGTIANTVLANDVWPQHLPATVELMEEPPEGELTLNSNGTFSFRATEPPPLEVRFAYRIVVDDAISNVAYVTIHAQDEIAEEGEPAATPQAPPEESPPAEADAGDDASVPPQSEMPAGDAAGPAAEQPAPVTQNDSYEVPAGGTIQVDVLANDSGSAGGPLVVLDHTLPQHGILTLFSDGKGTYAHGGGAATTDSFGYTVGDGSVASDRATVTITIAPSEAGMGGPEEAPAQPVQERPQTPPPPPPVPTGPLPTGIVLNADGMPLIASIQIRIMSSGRTVLADQVKAYYETSVESAMQLDAVRDEPLVMPVFELDGNRVDIILDAEQSALFVDLISQRDYLNERKIVVVGSD